MKSLIERLDRLSGPLAAALGLANALFALCFLVVVFIASQTLAARAAECTGVNLLEKMKTDDPAAYQQVMDEAKKTIFGDTLLFRIDKAGSKPSFLFGTMHLTDPRVVDMGEKAKGAFGNMKVVAIESTEILDPAKAQMAMLSKPELTMFMGDERLSDYLNDEQRAILQAGLEKRGIQLALVDRMKPWLLTSMVALPKCEMERKASGESFLDLKIAQDAQRTGKQLIGLETIVEQLDAMNSLPVKFHVNSLIQSILLGDKVDDFIETTIELYASGQIGAVWPTLRVAAAEFENGESETDYTAFEETMVHVRNRTMLDRALPLLKTGGVFVAVGALHLPGEKGLANLVKQAGYTVTPVYP